MVILYIFIVFRIKHRGSILFVNFIGMLFYLTAVVTVFLSVCLKQPLGGQHDCRELILCNMILCRLCIIVQYSHVSLNGGDTVRYVLRNASLCERHRVYLHKLDSIAYCTPRL